MSLDDQSLVSPADFDKALPMLSTLSHLMACALGRLVKLAKRQMFSLLGSAISASAVVK